MAILTYLGLQFLLPYQLHHKENIMGEFKPMVKMETTEPSIELKLKKGGSVAEAFKNAKASNKGENGHSPMKKAIGGNDGLGVLASASPSMIAPQSAPPTARMPMKPSLALRRRAMATPQRGALPVRGAMPTTPMVLRKKGGGAEGSKAEEKGESKTEMRKETKAGKSKNYATGGVILGNGGGYKCGGGTKKATGGVVLGNSGGFKDGGTTGEVKLGNAGGFKKGGATKKFANGGSAVAMPEGKKKPTPPVAINMLSGTFKNGGNVKKFRDGGDAEQRANTKGYNDTFANEKAENEADAKAVNDAMLYIPRKIKSLYDKAKNALTDTPTPSKKSGGKV